MNYQELKDLFYESVGDSENVQTIFTNEQVAIWTNKAINELVEELEYIDEEIDTTTAVGFSDYVVYQDQVRVWRVEVDDRKMLLTTIEDLEAIDQRWDERLGRPTRYYMDRLIKSDGFLHIGLWEKASAIWAIKCMLYGSADQVTDATAVNELDVPEWFAPSLLLSVLSDAYDCDTMRANADVSRLYRMMFEDAKVRLRARNYSRLSKNWSYDSRSSTYRGRVLDRMPLHIPAP